MSTTQRKPRQRITATDIVLIRDTLQSRLEKRDDGMVRYKARDDGDDVVAKETGIPTQSIRRVRQELFGKMFSQSPDSAHSNMAKKALKVQTAALREQVAELDRLVKYLYNHLGEPLPPAE